MMSDVRQLISDLEAEYDQEQGFLGLLRADHLDSLGGADRLVGDADRDLWLHGVLVAGWRRCSLARMRATPVPTRAWSPTTATGSMPCHGIPAAVGTTLDTPPHHRIADTAMPVAITAVPVAIAGTPALQPTPVRHRPSSAMSSVNATGGGATGGVGSSLTPGDLSGSTLSNYNRFLKSLPSGAEEPTITQLADGNIQFDANVPVSNIPGSYSTYTKVVDRAVTFYKTTYAPDGSVVHVKVKYP